MRAPMQPVGAVALVGYRHDEVFVLEDCFVNGVARYVGSALDASVAHQVEGLNYHAASRRGILSYFALNDTHRKLG